jgi:prolipoprotein diacylglyceryl transferase
MLAGAVVGLWRAKRRGLDAPMVANCAAPALPLAQAIGRWGNYFNQELFGKPTDLPWALRVSGAKASQAGYPPGTTFHPTFLYESLWNLALCGALLAIDKRFKIRPGSLMAMYVIGYGIGRFWVEGLRIDPAHSYGGLRLNQWVALGVVVAALGYLLFVSGRPVRERAAVVTASAIVADDVVDEEAPVVDAPAEERSESDPDGEHRYGAEDV